MSDPIVIVTLAGVVVTLLGALVATVWRGSSVVTRLESALHSVRESVTKIESGLSRLERIPVHENEIETLKIATAHISGRLDHVWRKVFSLDKHVAVINARQSSPDLDPSTPSDPPEKP